MRLKALIVATSLLISSTARSSDCHKARPINAGEPSPCAGLVISSSQAKDCIACKTVEAPSLKKLLELEKQKTEKYKTLSEQLRRDLDLAASATVDSGFTTQTVLLFALTSFALGVSAGVYMGTSR